MYKRNYFSTIFIKIALISSNLCVVIFLTGMKWADDKVNKEKLSKIKNIAIIIVGKQQCNVEYSRAQGQAFLGLIGRAMTSDQDMKRIEDTNTALSGWNIREELCKILDYNLSKSTSWNITSKKEITGGIFTSPLDDFVARANYTLLMSKLNIDHLLQLKVEEYGIRWKGLFGTKSFIKLKARIVDLNKKAIIWDATISLEGQDTAYELLIADNAVILRQQFNSSFEESTKRILGDLCYIDYRGLQQYSSEKKGSKLSSRRGGR